MHLKRSTHTHANRHMSGTFDDSTHTCESFKHLDSGTLHDLRNLKRRSIKFSNQVNDHFQVSMDLKYIWGGNVYFVEEAKISFSRFDKALCSASPDKRLRPAFFFSHSSSYRNGDWSPVCLFSCFLAAISSALENVRKGLSSSTICKMDDHIPCFSLFCIAYGWVT